MPQSARLSEGGGEVPSLFEQCPNRGYNFFNWASRGEAGVNSDVWGRGFTYGNGCVSWKQVALCQKAG